MQLGFELLIQNKVGEGQTVMNIDYSLSIDKKLKNNKLLHFSNRKIITIYSCFTMLVYLTNNKLVLSAIAIVFPIIFGILNPMLGISLLVSTFFIGSKITGTVYVFRIVVLEFMVIFSQIVLKKNYSIKKRALVMFFLIIIAILLSILFAKVIIIKQILIIFLCALLYLIIKSYISEENVNFIFYAIVLNAIMMMLVIVYESVVGSNNVLLYGRLSFGGNIRIVANTVVFPLYILIASKILKINSLNPIHRKLNHVLIVAVLLIALLISVSRGAIIAFMTSMVLIIISNKKNNKGYMFLLFFSLAVAMYFLLHFQIIRMERLLYYDATLSGRVMIYMTALGKYFNQSILNILFGLGPGSFSWIVSGSIYADYYAHSVFISILIEYGLFGLCLIITIIFRVIIRSVKRKNIFDLGLCLLTVVLYSTHGVAGTTFFWLMMALSSSLLEMDYTKVSI